MHEDDLTSLGNITHHVLVGLASRMLSTDPSTGYQTQIRYYPLPNN